MDVLLGSVDWEHESLFLLECLAGAHDNEDRKWSDYEKTCRAYAERYELCQAEVDTLCEAYAAVRALSLPEKETLLLFGLMGEDADETSFAQLTYCLGEAVKTGIAKPKALAAMLDLPLPSEDGDAVIRMLSEADFSPQTKWLCLEALYSTDARIREIRGYIDRVQAALEPFCPRLQAMCDRWHARMQKLVEQNGVEAFFESAGMKTDGQPMLLQPSPFSFAGIMIRGDQILQPANTRLDTCCGVFIDEICEQYRRRRMDEGILLAAVHALDDKSRLKILKALAQRPRNGRELAALTSLSPATVSHHMSDLINASFVTVEKKGASILYNFSPEALEDALQGLRDYVK